MEENSNPNAFERAAKDLVDYVNLRADGFKLGALENLSVLFSVLFSVVIFLIIGGMALAFFAIAATWGLAELIGSSLYAVLIMGGILTIAAVIVLVKRRTLIVNQAVKLLSKMIFDTTKKFRDYE